MYFAEVDDAGTVIRVIVAEQDFIDSRAVGDPTRWVQTSYDTKQGVNENGGAALRKNYAGIGSKYDKDRDAFIPPKPESFVSWVLDEQKGVYVAPKPLPADAATKPYSWDEGKLDWVDIAIAIAVDPDPVVNP